MNLFQTEAERREAFPICHERIFLAHAAVTVLPRCVADAMHRYIEIGAMSHQENEQTWREVKATRELAAKLLGVQSIEIALLGPTALGLSLIASGLAWKAGDEVVCYGDDYPANVYPWLDLQRQGVVVRMLKPERPGEITPELVSEALTDRTKLVALASANFLTGTRIDVSAIGHLLHQRGVLFAVDAIQTLGAFPFDATHVDFLSADAHKWLLGPCAIGVLMVKQQHFEKLRPTLLGSWNVFSPGFIAQDSIRFVPTAQRYEPGTLNLAGVYGLKAALELLLNTGIDRIAGRLMELKAHLLAHLHAMGFEIFGQTQGPFAHAITTCRSGTISHAALFHVLAEKGIVCSLRQDRAGREWLRFSPHFYNTEKELDRTADTLRRAIS
jgi:selenocysteine lyase/cysteine desulfurase